MRKIVFRSLSLLVLLISALLMIGSLVGLLYITLQMCNGFEWEQFLFFYVFILLGFISTSFIDLSIYLENKK